jgi:hypothetical protein
MKLRRLLCSVLLASVLVSATACDPSDPSGPNPDAGTQEPDAGTQEPDAGEPDGGPFDGGTTLPDGGSTLPDGGTALPDGGSQGPDGGPRDPDPNDPDNAIRDTDCDGLSDKVEFETDRGNGQRTRADLADTDGDGLQDGLELSISQPVAGTSCTLPQDADVALRTSPVNPDTDGDGLRDGVEDANRNGKADVGETHPLLRDSDCDGLIDGPNVGSVEGEDQNANGLRDNNETDPHNSDTDGDGLLDGLELGVTVNVDPVNCTGFVPDVDPGTGTDATDSDTDGDGVMDGAEDSNQNGRVDPRELDPNVSDATGPAGQVCTANNLRTVSFQPENEPDIQLALPPSFTEVTQIRVGAEVKGLVGYDNTTNTSFLAFRRPAPTGATDPLGDEEALRPAVAATGALRNRTAQLFRTWDGFNAVQVFYDQTGASADIKLRTNQLVDALVPGSTGRLGSAAGVQGDFRLQALIVHRSTRSVVVLIAVTPLAGVTGENGSQPAVFISKDLSKGSALAQFGEPTGVQCERFLPPPAKVDFLFVVDDSGSMQSSQQALAVAAQSVVEVLNASLLDWRMAMVTSSYHIAGEPNSARLRKFTRNLNKMRAWLTQGSTCTANVCSGVPTTPAPPACPGDTSEGANGGCWVNIDGSGNEGVLGAARKALDDITPGTAPDEPESATRARADAQLVVVLLGDADDQTTGYSATAGVCGTGGTVDRAGSACESVQNFIHFFGDVASGVPPTNRTGQRIAVHGIVCPSGSNCGCDTNGTNCEFNPKPANGGQRHAAVINATGGVNGSILDLNSIQASMDAIISDAILRRGYRMLRPPIGASIKVALDRISDPAACMASNIPRSTVNGFDFDGSLRTLTFFGACRPADSSAQAAVSYRYWVDTVSDPNRGAPCMDDPNYTPNEPDHCIGPTLGCNEASGQCICNPNCGDTCGAGTVCDMTTCSCESIIE